ncbi:unnamed protein product [Spodoptera exigua]|nr:unnamed protein product [Spodoptera exigua]
MQVSWTQHLSTISVTSPSTGTLHPKPRGRPDGLVVHSPSDTLLVSTEPWEESDMTHKSSIASLDLLMMDSAALHVTADTTDHTTELMIEYLPSSSMHMMLSHTTSVDLTASTLDLQRFGLHDEVPPSHRLPGVELGEDLDSRNPRLRL